LHDEVVLVLNAIAKNLIPFQPRNGFRRLGSSVHDGIVALAGTERNGVRRM
jgi:hypothetical protein